MTRRGLFGLLAAVPVGAKAEPVDPQHPHDWVLMRGSSGALIADKQCRLCGRLWSDVVKYENSSMLEMRNGAKVAVGGVPYRPVERRPPALLGDVGGESRKCYFRKAMHRVRNQASGCRSCQIPAFAVGRGRAMTPRCCGTCGWGKPDPQQKWWIHCEAPLPDCLDYGYERLPSGADRINDCACWKERTE
jgi:hypothetical protein